MYVIQSKAGPEDVGANDTAAMMSENARAQVVRCCNNACRRSHWSCAMLTAQAKMYTEIPLGSWQTRKTASSSSESTKWLFPRSPLLMEQENYKNITRTFLINCIPCAETRVRYNQRVFRDLVPL